MLEKIKRFNFWGNNDIPLGYERTDYTSELARYTGNNLIKVLVGQRRSGKSFILRQLAAELIQNKGVRPENTLFINVEFFDSEMDKTRLSLDTLYNEFRSEVAGKGRVYLFIDEIQNIDGWEEFVNARSQDYIDDCEVFITGSNSHLLSGELASLLSGRYIEFKIFPYSYSEYIGVKGLEKSRSSYMEYLKDGSLPELQNLGGFEMKRNYMASIRDTVMLRDIVSRFKIKDVQLLGDIFTYIVNNASSLISVKNIVNYFNSQKRKTNYETVATYLGYLESAFLIHKSQRYNIKGKELLTGNAKYYINDLGFRNYLYRGIGYGDGYLLENAIYIELLRRGYEVHTGAASDKEIDFVAIKDDDRLYVQVSLELDSDSTIEREYRPLRQIQDHFRKYVVTLDQYPQPSDGGIENIRAWEF